MIEKYKQKRKEDGVSVRTINIELACLRHMFNMALKWGKVQKNPVMRLNYLRNLKGKIGYSHPEEEVKSVRGDRASKRAGHLEPIIVTGLLTGMRLSEVLNLKWSNVDLNNPLNHCRGDKERIRSGRFP